MLKNDGMFCFNGWNGDGLWSIVEEEEEELSIFLTSNK